MTVLNYMKEIRERIAERHIGETFFVSADGEAVKLSGGAEKTESAVKPRRTVYDILREIDAMQGLNLKERIAARDGVPV